MKCSDLDETYQRVYKDCVDYVRNNRNDRSCIVLDIDDTVLCSSNDSKEIKGIKSIYDWSIRHSLPVFFVTARSSRYDPYTMDQLMRHGMGNYVALYSRRSGYNDIEFSKIASRAHITNHRDLEVLVNIGDQKTDLTGPYFRRGYKLPDIS